MLAPDPQAGTAVPGGGGRLASSWGSSSHAPARRNGEAAEFGYLNAMRGFSVPFWRRAAILPPLLVALQTSLLLGRTNCGGRGRGGALLPPNASSRSGRNRTCW